MNKILQRFQLLLNIILGVKQMGMKKKIYIQNLYDYINITGF